MTGTKDMRRGPVRSVQFLILHYCWLSQCGAIIYLDYNYFFDNDIASLVFTDCVFTLPLGRLHATVPCGVFAADFHSDYGPGFRNLHDDR